MAAATMNIPAICMNVGPMLNGEFDGMHQATAS
jgi:dihydroxyacid dehydratase/phosphogluconate dehydratase